jgi:hypothetical protein
LAKIWPTCQSNSPQARIADSSSIEAGQLFTRAHDETLSIGAMRVSNEHRSPVVFDCRMTDDPAMM